MRKRYGQRDACHICGQDIEWSGKKHGWTDRGGNRDCVPYLDRDHEFVYPTSKHEPASEQRMTCGCRANKDESKRVFGKKATRSGDWAYCPRHGDVRLK